MLRMASRKPAAKKRRLIRAGKSNSSVPVWVIARTKGYFRRHPKQRHWRRKRLKL